MKELTIERVPYREKMKINYITRHIVRILFAGLLAASAAGLIWSYDVPEEEVEYMAYHCLQEAALDYRVQLVPNDYFAERVLEPGRAYITALTDQVIVDYEYRFIGESEAEINGRYGVTATLVALTSKEEHLVWEKDYELLPAQRFSAVDSDIVITGIIDVPFAEYLAFTELLKTEIGYNPAELNLIVSFDTSVQAETKYGVVTGELSPTLLIPMRGNTFIVSGNLTEEIEGGITATKTVTGLQLENAGTVFYVLIFASVIALIFLSLFTAPVKAKTKSGEQKIFRILKKHRGRIVTTTNGLPSIPEGAVEVTSFEELLKLADEVERPILYPRPKSGNSGDHCFLIYTPEKVYAYGASEKPASN